MRIEKNYEIAFRADENKIFIEYKRERTKNVFNLFRTFLFSKGELYDLKKYRLILSTRLDVNESKS